jgi:hypothetical protein
MLFDLFGEDCSCASLRPLRDELVLVKGPLAIVRKPIRVRIIQGGSGGTSNGNHPFWLAMHQAW